MNAILKDHPKVLADPEAVVKVNELADSSVNFVVRPWVKTEDYLDTLWDITREVKLRFDAAGSYDSLPAAHGALARTKST